MRADTVLGLALTLMVALFTACGPSEEEQNATATQMVANIITTQTAEAPTPTNTSTPTPIPTDTPTPTNTPTPTATATATPTPSATPTITPTPTPDFASMLLSLDDLPPGFEKLSSEMMDFFVGDGFTDSFESSAAFMHEEPFYFVVQMTSELSGFEANVFDIQASNPELLALDGLSGFGISSLEDEAVLDYAPIEGLEEVGELASGANVDVIMEGAPFAIDMVSFRRGDFGIVLIVMTFAGTEPEVQITELARLADLRIMNQQPGGEGVMSGQPSFDVECDDPLGCVVISPEDPILLASALIISGPNATLGQDSQYGVELALEFREEVLGHPLELQAEDDGCNAQGGQTSATKIVSNPQVVAMIGTSCSGAGVPASEIISDAGYVMVSPSNTSPALTDPDQAFHEGYLRTSHNDLIQSMAMADFAYNELGLTKAATIHDGDPYTEGLAASFATFFELLGGQIVAFETEASDASNVEPLLASIAAAEPEMIYFPVFIPLGSLITNTARDIEALDDVILAASDGIQSPSFLQNTVGTSAGMYISGPDLNFENVFYINEFLPAYEARYGTQPTAPFHAHAFDATIMVLAAVEEVAQQASDGTLLIGRQALRDALYSTSGFEGITGTLTCDEFGDCADARVSISIVEGNEFVRIWP